LYVFLAGPFAWAGLLYASLHPSLALVFVVPFMPLHIENDALAWMNTDVELGGKHNGGDHGQFPLHEFEESTKCFVDFVVLFAFGVANGGVELSSVGGLTFAVLIALVVGKTGGIALASALATMLGCPPPSGLDLRSVITIGFIASAGLTVALFVAGEAFEPHPILSAQAKMGALLSIMVAVVAIVGSRVTGKMASRDCVEEKLSVERESSDDTDDESLENVVVESTVKNLHFIQQTETEIEHRAHITRSEALSKMRRQASE